ncbi:MAG: hypothetical protein JWO31_681, partial [Phycisphaerales bacterium]|nr:hypothetical protein [Phycisphaerales bacterium]
MRAGDAGPGRLSIPTMTRKHLGFGKAAAIGLALAAVPALRGAPVTAAAPAASPASPAAAVPVGGTGELSVARGHTLPGGKAGEPDVCLGVIPTRPISGKVWLNPFTNAVEQRITPAVLHPIPTLRAAHVLL